MVFAVKPQMLAAALPHYEDFAANGAAAISIAAGWRLAGFEAALGAKTPVVRAMPNTPAAVGRGMSSEEHTSELQSIMPTSYAVSCLTTKTRKNERPHFRTAHT